MSVIHTINTRFGETRFWVFQSRGFWRAQATIEGFAVRTEDYESESDARAAIARWVAEMAI